MSATFTQPEKSGQAQKTLSEGFAPPDMNPLSGDPSNKFHDPSTTTFLVSHTNTSWGHALTCRWLLLRSLVKFMVRLLLPICYIPHKTCPALEAWAPLFAKRIIRLSGMALNERPRDQSVRWISATLMITPAADGKQRLVPQAPPEEGTSQKSCCVTLMSGVQLCAWWHCWGQRFWKLLLNQPLLPLGRRFAS